MANWTLFNDTKPSPTAILINLDRVKLIQPGVEVGTITIDGVVVRGDISQILQVIDYTIYSDI